MKPIAITTGLMLLSGIALAETVTIDVPLPPKLDRSAVVTPERQQAEEQRRQSADGDELPPNVTVVRGENATVYEYRRDGSLYRTEIDPKYGPAYIFEDTNGDGSLNDGVTGPGKQESQSWSLMRW